MLQLFTLIFGAVALMLPAYLTWYWWPDRGGVGRVFAWAMSSEAWNMLVAWAFAFMSYVEYYNSMGPVDAMVLRWTLFGYAIYTTTHAIRFMARHKMPLIINARLLIIIAVVVIAVLALLQRFLGD